MHTDVCTYFISDGYAVKIGHSRDVKKRLQSLQTSSSRPLILLGTLVGDHEKRLHQEYKDHRVSGEWFSLVVLNFYTWLMLQVDRDDWIGDFASDTQGCRTYPREEDSYPAVRSFVRWYPGSCREARVGLALAYREWSRLRRRAGLNVPTVRAQRAQRAQRKSESVNNKGTEGTEGTEELKS